MPDSLQLSAVDHLAHDRIHDLYATATETRTDARRAGGRSPGARDPHPLDPRPPADLARLGRRRPAALTRSSLLPGPGGAPDARRRAATRAPAPGHRLVVSQRPAAVRR